MNNAILEVRVVEEEEAAMKVALDGAEADVSFIHIFAAREAPTKGSSSDMLPPSGCEEIFVDWNFTSSVLK